MRTLTFSPLLSVHDRFPQDIRVNANADLSLLVEPEAFQLLDLCARFPSVIVQAAQVRS